MKEFEKMNIKVKMASKRTRKKEFSRRGKTQENQRLPGGLFA